MNQISRLGTRAGRWWRRPLAMVLIAAAVVGGWLYFAPTGAAPSRTVEQAAPVHVAVVERRAFPITLTGLGTVQATNTVTVRSRVDGQIEKVGFEEGQMVK